MLAIYEYAVLASNAYHPDTYLFGVALNTINKKTTHKEDGWYLADDVNPDIASTNHFYAALYIKFMNGKASDAVVAVRGTVISDYTNQLVDIYSWYSDVIGDKKHDHEPPKFFQLLTHFVVMAQSYIENYFPTVERIRITGHSLGGALAQLISLQANLGHYVIAFNSPGVGHLPGVMANQQGWITNVNARYDVISKIGQTLGNTYLIDVPEQAATAASLFEHFDMADFGTADSLYYWQQNFSAVQTKIFSLIKTALIARHWPSVQMQYDHCLVANQTLIPVNELSALMSTLKCYQDVTTQAIANTILAQHSIDNLIAALYQTTNRTIAYKLI